MPAIARTSATSSPCSGCANARSNSKITVTDAEVDQYLAMLKVQNTGGETEYKLAHILVMVPEQASSDQIDAKKRRAEERCGR
jgi:peptidyl-prolyl cis-trans isomerase SurA